jgi:3-oxoacyl-[acyl-carrier protein] reductase
MGKLAGRVAIVTGGGRSIGRATAELFAQEGAKVVVATLSAAPGQETVDAIRAKGGEAILVQIDMGDREAVRQLIKTTVDSFGGIDIIVHNAAYIPFATLDALSDDDLDKTFAVGVMAAFWLTRDALPYLEKSKAGRILVTSSITGLTSAVVGMSHYASVKSALNGFVRGAGLELARKGITVNAVAPGLTDSDQLRRTASAAHIAHMSEQIPIPRPALSIEQAYGFLFLASDEAAYITGTVLPIDGGSLLGKPGGIGLDQI